MSAKRALILLSTALVLVFAAPVYGGVVTNSSEDLRTGWYPESGAITPQLVTGGTFGQLWSTNVEGAVYAQPLLEDGTLMVETEENKVYGLDPATGALKWSKPLNLGTPWNPADIECGDLTPYIGVTATPVIDTSTNIAYFTHKTYVSGSSGPARWYMDAVSVATGQEQPGFPVELAGSAQNAPSRTFDATDQLNRPGLLLLEGTVYAAFGSDCDHGPWQGWVFGVSTSGQVKARWITVQTEEGAGIWQSGAGITSDGPGTMLVSTGNGGAPRTPAPGSQPPANCGECIIRLRVQPDGTLKATDFFAPYDAEQLDQNDADFASGGITGLPNEYFGTESVPHLAVAVGKEGNVYLLNRDSLGGYQQGPSGSDAVVQRIGPRGGVWSRPGVWPGEGGWIYIPTSSGNSAGGNLDVYKYGISGEGQPSLSLQGSSTDAFGWGSSAPVITSEGTTSGSALVWVIWMANREGNGGQLRAYDPVPSGGHPVEVFSAPIGIASTYATPGVGAGRLYVGNREGKVMAFGSPVVQPLTGPSLAFGSATVGTTAQKSITLTATTELTVSSLTSSSSQFKVGTSTPALPAKLKAGETITVPVTFAPTETGGVGGQLTATTTGERSASFSLSGTGQAAGAQLQISPRNVLSFGGTSVGSQLSETVTVSNLGSAPLKIEHLTLPAAPFRATNPPGEGATIAPGGSLNVNVDFEPTQTGSFESSFGVQSNGGSESIVLTGQSGSPGTLSMSSELVNFGSVAVGETVVKTFTITNTGGTNVTITKSKPPSGGSFSALTQLQEGSTIHAGESVEEKIAFTPTAAGWATGTFIVNGDDVSGLHTIQFTGTGTVPKPVTTSWSTNGAAGIAGGWLTLTTPLQFRAGSSFFEHPLSSAHLTATFKSRIGGGTGADGQTFVLASPAEGASPASLGEEGGGLGFGGIPGVAVALDTYQSQGAPSSNFVGISTGSAMPGTLKWLATSTAVPSLRATRTVKVEVDEGTIAVSVEGQHVLSASVSLPPQILVGFTGATGELTDTHQVAVTSIVGAPTPKTSKLTITNAVVAPKGSAAAGASMVMSGACPVPFTTAALASKKTATPSLPGAREGLQCSVREAQPAAEGGTWTTTASVNGAAPVTLAAVGGELQVPVFALHGGANTVKLVNEWVEGAKTTTLPEPTAGGWQLNGTSAIAGSELVLTPASEFQAGSTFWPTQVDPQSMTVEYDASITGGSGADGLAFVLADASKGGTATQVGAAGGGLGFSGIPGLAVALDEYKNEVNPSANFVGLTEGPVAGKQDELAWLATDNLTAPLQGATTQVKIVFEAGTVTAFVGGTQVLSHSATVPAAAYVGFSAGTGGLTNRHAISHVTITIR
jgi:hypothetical protein